MHPLDVRNARVYMTERYSMVRRRCSGMLVGRATGAWRCARESPPTTAERTSAPAPTVSAISSGNCVSEPATTRPATMPAL